MGGGGKQTDRNTDGHCEDLNELTSRKREEKKKKKERKRKRKML